MIFLEKELVLVKKKDLFLKVSDLLYFDDNLDLFVRISENLYTPLFDSDKKPQLTPIFTKERVSILDNLEFSLNRGQGESDIIEAHDSLSFDISALKEDVLSVSEGLALFKEHFTELQEGATITESVSIIIIKGSGIINGATINGAII